MAIPRKCERETLAELRAHAEFGKDPAFVLEAFDSGWTVTQAELEYLRRQVCRAQEFMDCAKRRASERHITIGQAIKQLRREQPELHAAWHRRHSQEAKRGFQGNLRIVRGLSTYCRDES